MSFFRSTGNREYRSAFHRRPYKYVELRNQIEMKLLQHFFVEQYALEGFDFASYLHACFDKSFLELCEVEVRACEDGSKEERSADAARAAPLLRRFQRH